MTVEKTIEEPKLSNFKKSLSWSIRFVRGICSIFIKLIAIFTPIAIIMRVYYDNKFFNAIAEKQGEEFAASLKADYSLMSSLGHKVPLMILIFIIFVILISLLNFAHKKIIGYKPRDGKSVKTIFWVLFIINVLNGMSGCNDEERAIFKYKMSHGFNNTE